METHEKIEMYLSGQMSGDERIEFEKEIKNNPVLMKQLELDKALVQEIKRQYKLAKDHPVQEHNEGLRRENTFEIGHYEFKDNAVPKIKAKLNIELVDEVNNRAFVEKQISQGRKTLNRRKNLKLAFYSAVSLAAVLFLFVFMPGILQKNKFENLYTSAYQVYPNDYLSVDATFRGDTKIDSLELTAMTAYENNDFIMAERKFKEILSTGENLDLRFFLAISQLENGKTDDAIESLQALYSLPENFKYYEQTRWYLALTYLKIQRKDEAKRFLNELSEIKGYYRDKVNDLNKLIK